jgi:hypothetical protein
MAVSPIVITNPLGFQLISHAASRSRCLHVPTFVQQVKEFQQYLPLSGRIAAEQASFLPLYGACLCASLHLMTDDVLKTTGYSQEERTAALSDWSEIVELSMVKIDWAGSPRLETLQAFM